MNIPNEGTPETVSRLGGTRQPGEARPTGWEWDVAISSMVSPDLTLNLRKSGRRRRTRVIPHSSSQRLVRTGVLVTYIGFGFLTHPFSARHGRNPVTPGPFLLQLGRQPEERCLLRVATSKLHTHRKPLSIPIEGN